MKHAKKSLFMSAISLLLCISMLMGTTFAWFTDSVKSGRNTIAAGNLDVELLADGKPVDSETVLFDDVKLWEPGVVAYENLQIKNVGSLALKYQLTLDSIAENATTDGHKLSEVVKIALVDKIERGASRADILAAAKASAKYGSLADFQLSGSLEAGAYTDEAGVVVFWEPGENDNWYNLKNGLGTDNGKPLSIEFGVKLVATQFTKESDSFGSDYDLGATFDDLANTAIFATETKTLAEGKNSVGFNLAYNGMTVAKVTVPASALADPAQPVTVTFDGIDPSQAAIVDENTMAYAFDISVTNLKEELSGDQLVTVVVTAPIALAAMKAYHNGVLIENAVYDEVAGTITFKTDSFSPYSFTSQVEEVATLEALRAALQKDGTTAKLIADIAVDLTKDTGAARDINHAYEGSSKTYYNGVKIEGEDVGLDLNGHSITAFCGDAYNSNSDVGALFFVGNEGSLNITNTGAVSTGFIKMESSIYAVWAPFADPSYVDIYAGAFIGDSYAGDPIGTALDSNGNPDPENGTMKNENSNRALIYAGFGGNMNVYGGYFLYNNTPNDTLDRNNGAFNAKDFYEGERPLLVIHKGVKLSNKEYRQNPQNTSQPHGSYDNYSVKLAKDCEIAKVESPTAVLIDGKVYYSWYQVVEGLTSISAKTKKNVYDVGYEFSEDDFIVSTTSANGVGGLITDYTISAVNTSVPGTPIVTVTYEREDGTTLTTQCVVQVMHLKDTSNTIKAPDGNTPQYQKYFNAGNFNVSGWANIDGDINGNKITEPSYASMIGKTFEGRNGEIATGFNLDIVNGTYGENYYDLTVENAKQFTSLGINCLVAYNDVSNPVKGFGCYIDDDRSTLTWNSPAIVFIGSGQTAGNLPGTSYQVDDNTYGAWGANNAYALTTMNCANLKAGQTYTVHWVVVFEDGLSELSQWTVEMAEADNSDAMFEDTIKPDANVIIMAGQSNMFGASPLTQSIQNKYAGYNFSNVFIKYNNINFDVDENGKIIGTLSTVFSNNTFEKYKLGIGGQSNNYFGPETTLASILSTTEGLSDKKWFIIKYAPAGTALSSQWTGGCQVNGKNTTLTDDMLSYVQTAIDELSGQYDVRIQSFLWMQGESDAINKATAEGYAALEKNLVERVRNRFAAYATRTVGSIPGSGISFVTAGIADNDTDMNTAQGGPNDWVYAELVNAGKISNSQWLCSIKGAETNSALTAGPLKGYTFGKDKPTIPNPKQDGTIVNSIYIDTHHLLSKLNSTSEHEEYLPGDRTDWAHYGAGSMDELGSLFGACVHYLMITDTGPVQQRITFEADGGSVENGKTQYAYVGEKITLPTATKEGYTFNGWYTAATGGEPIGKADDEYLVNGSVTMYAQWTEVPKVQYTVTYNANGGSVSPTSVKVDEGDSVTLPTPSRTGYTFKCWSDGTKEYAAGANYTPAGNVALTAQWTVNKYTVTIKASITKKVTVNGTNYSSNKTITVDYGSTVTVKENNTLSNPTITAKDANGNVLYSGTNGSFVMPASDVTITIS